jgi:hypothetical protein
MSDVVGVAGNTIAPLLCRSRLPKYSLLVCQALLAAVDQDWALLGLCTALACFNDRVYGHPRFR